MIKFFRCEKCNFQFFAKESRVTSDTFRCGAVVEYLMADDSNVGEDGPISSHGIKPLGCGGRVNEITKEEAMKL